MELRGVSVDVNERKFVRVALDTATASEANYGNPNTNVGTANFGIINRAGLPRIVQLAVRLGF